MNFLLLRDYFGQPCEGWLMSEKLDGWRLLWDGSEFVLRSGEVLNVPDSWKVGMPSCPLDGELFAGRGEFNSISTRIANGFDGLKFYVFDAPSALPFKRRIQALAGMDLPPHVELVRFQVCRDTQHLVEFADDVVSNGGEGAVVRDPKAKHESGRTDSVLRWVPQLPKVNRRKVAA
jgi:DNA ligase-1